MVPSARPTLFADSLTQNLNCQASLAFSRAPVCFSVASVLGAHNQETDMRRRGTIEGHYADWQSKLLKNNKKLCFSEQV